VGLLSYRATLLVVEHVYRELPPPPSLAAHLRCLWFETTGDRHDAEPMRVLPDGCIDVVWVAGDQPRMVGTATQWVFPGIPPGSSLVGARFAPGMAAGLLGAPAHVLANLEVPLTELWGRGSLDIDRRFDESGNVTAGLDEIERLLTWRLARIDEAGDRLVTAAAQVLVGEPGTPLDVLVDRSGLSSRQLRRRFEAAIGYGPKTFQRVMRFRRWLRLVEASPDDRRSLADLAAEAGYADQAHLTREVARLAGLPPAALLNESG
jgi:AraC-like DNA-binding protein